MRSRSSASDPSCGVRLQPWLANGRCKFEVADLRALPYPDRSFDAVVCLRLLPHSVDWTGLIGELCRVASRSVLLDYPSVRSVNIVAERFFEVKKGIELNTRRFLTFSPRQIRAPSRINGFVVLRRAAAISLADGAAPTCQPVTSEQGRRSARPLARSYPPIRFTGDRAGRPPGSRIAAWFAAHFSNLSLHTTMSRLIGRFLACAGPSVHRRGHPGAHPAAGISGPSDPLVVPDMWGSWRPGRDEQCSAVHSFCARPAVRRVALAAVVATGGLVSLGIELLQWSVVPGRDASLSDVLTNTLGSLVGATLASHRGSAAAADRSAVAARLPPAGVPCGSPFSIGSALLLQPWAPADQLRGFWARRVLGHRPFEGRSFRRLSRGFRSPPTPSLSLLRWRRHDPDRRFDLQLRLRSGRSGKRSSVVEVLGPRGSVVAVEANRWRPRVPTAHAIVSPSPGTASPSDSWRPELATRHRAHPRGTGPGVRAGGRMDQFRPDPAGPPGHLARASGGACWRPFDTPMGGSTSVITLVWLAAWLLPLGYWTRHVSGRPFLSWGAAAPAGCSRSWAWSRS